MAVLASNDHKLVSMARIISPAFPVEKFSTFMPVETCFLQEQHSIKVIIRNIDIFFIIFSKE